MPKLMGMLPNYFEHWLDPVFELANEYGKQYAHTGAHHTHALEWGLMGCLGCHCPYRYLHRIYHVYGQQDSAGEIYLNFPGSAQVRFITNGTSMKSTIFSL